MVGVAQLVEHPVVVRDVAGSSPVAHPNIINKYVPRVFIHRQMEIAKLSSWPSFLTKERLALSKFIIKILSKLLILATQYSKKDKQSINVKIRHYYKIARLSTQYKSVPLSLIESLITSTQEKTYLDFTFYRH